MQDILMPSESNILWACRHDLVAFFLIRRNAIAVNELAQLVGESSSVAELA